MPVLHEAPLAHAELPTVTDHPGWSVPLDTPPHSIEASVRLLYGSLAFSTPRFLSLLCDSFSRSELLPSSMSECVPSPFARVPVHVMSHYLAFSSLGRVG